MPESLEEYVRLGKAKLDGRELYLLVADWAHADENRLGYPRIMRLIECVREHHWDVDVRPAGEQVDSITHSLTAAFHSPVRINTELKGSYRVIEVLRHAYTLEISLNNEADGEPLVTAQLVCVCYDARAERKAVIPAGVRSRLEQAVTGSRH